MNSNRAVSPRRVTIVGGGFSGASVAVQLVRASSMPLEITIVEPRSSVGAGLAHSADDPDHRLNGPSEIHMVDPADHGAFQRWCTARRLAETDPDAVAPDGSLFARRKDFGAFVGETVSAHAKWSTGSTIRHVRDIAIGVSTDAGAVTVQTGQGHALPSELLVVATGNMVPRLPAEFAPNLSAKSGVVAVPTDLERLRAIPKSAQVLVIGSGLTALDILSTLVRSDHRGPITVISRRGLRPRANLPRRATDYASPAQAVLDRINGPVAPFIQAAGNPPTVLDLMKALRTRISEVEAGGGTWYTPFDSLRDVLWQVWPRVSASEKKRFMKHLRPWWDAHRFRAPPQNEAMVRNAERGGSIVFQAARLCAVTESVDGRIRVVLRARNTQSERAEYFDAVINCTGLDTAGARDNPFLVMLQSKGLISTDGSGVGFAVDSGGRPIGVDGRAHDPMRIFGPPNAGACGDSFGAIFIAAQIQRALPNMLSTLGVLCSRNVSDSRMRERQLS